METRLENPWRLLWGPEPLVAAQAIFDERWEWLFSALAMVGYTHGMVIVASLAMLLGMRRVGYYALVAPTVALGMCAALWLVIDVPRPDYPAVRVVGPDLLSPSFPSGHTAMAVALYGPFAGASARVAAGVVAVTVGVGLTRLYLGLHHLGDVLAGALLGLMITTILPSIWPWLLDWLRRLPWSAFMLVGTLVAVGAALYPAIGPAHQGEEAGLIAGAALALPLEHRFLGVTGGPARRQHRLASAGALIGGVLLLLGLESLVDEALPWLMFLITTIASLWAFLLAPALFLRLGWVQGRCTAPRQEHAA